MEEVKQLQLLMHWASGVSPTRRVLNRDTERELPHCNHQLNLYQAQTNSRKHSLPFIRDMGPILTSPWKLHCTAEPVLKQAALYTGCAIQSKSSKGLKSVFNTAVTLKWQEIKAKIYLGVKQMYYLYLYYLTGSMKTWKLVLWIYNSLGSMTVPSDYSKWTNPKGKGHTGLEGPWYFHALTQVDMLVHNSHWLMPISQLLL